MQSVKIISNYPRKYLRVFLPLNPIVTNARNVKFVKQARRQGVSQLFSSSLRFVIRPIEKRTHPFQRYLAFF